MQAEIGQFLIILAFFMALSLAIFPMLGTFINNERLIQSARPLTYLIFASLLGAFICLQYAFLIDDFTVAYVASHSNSMLPTVYKMTAVWGGHEGSFLLWVLTLAGWMLFVALRTQHFPLVRYARVLSVLGFIALGFISFMLFTSNPFDRTLPFFPIDGSDLNPLLQDLAMIIHPPMLYMGYVGFAVAFAFAIAALIEGRWDAAWARRTRPWAISAWVCLTLGMALGSWWAYYELGWGGWWFWDPSENASFMPWLAGTALIHSLAVTDKRDSFKGWTLALSLITFSLCLFGTFIIRSGVITSVHAFSNDPERGVFILSFIAVVVGISMALFITRSGSITRRVDFDIWSKDMFLLLNNILLVAATFVVFYGTIYPLVAEMFGRKLSVGAPWFNAIFPWPMFLLFFLLGIGPLLNWKRHNIQQLLPTLVKIALLALGLTILSVLFFDTFYLWVFVGLFLSFWIAGSSLFFLTGIDKKQSIAKRLTKMSSANFGMVIAHIGVAVALTGILMTSLYDVEKDLRIKVGKQVEVGGYQFRMDKSEKVLGPNYQASRVTFTVSHNNNFVAQLAPEKRYYFAGKQVMTEASIDPGFTRDVYVSLGEPFDGAEQDWAVRIYIKPFIRWIWMGALIMGIGGILGALDRRFRARDTAAKKLQESAPKTLKSNNKSLAGEAV